MKKAKLLALACAVALATPAFAQFTTGGSGSSKGIGAAPAEISDYNQFGINYVNEAFKYDYPKGYDMEDMSLHGIGIRYIHGFSLSKSLPIYIETGLNFNANFGSYDNDDSDYYTIKTTYQHAALSIPVSVAYKFNVTESFAIKPYVGIDFKLNILGRHKQKAEKKEYSGDNDYDYDDWDYDDEDYWDSRASSKDEKETKWASWYSKKDMGSKDMTWNRFQMGWHIGANLIFNKFYVGIDYGTDFIKAFKYKDYKVNSATLNVGLGVYF